MLSNKIKISLSFIYLGITILICIHIILPYIIIFIFRIGAYCNYIDKSILSKFLIQLITLLFCGGFLIPSSLNFVISTTKNKPNMSLNGFVFGLISWSISLFALPFSFAWSFYLSIFLAYAMYPLILFGSLLYIDYKNYNLNYKYTPKSINSSPYHPHHPPTPDISTQHHIEPCPLNRSDYTKYDYSKPDYTKPHHNKHPIDYYNTKSIPNPNFNNSLEPHHNSIYSPHDPFNKKSPDFTSSPTSTQRIYKYCHNCGRKLLINELFCYYCGKKQWLF